MILNGKNICLLLVILTFASISSANQLFTYSKKSLIRGKRQSDECSTNFVCQSNHDCVSFEQVCDGNKDCDDGTDESSDVCVDYKPPPPSFYGKYPCGPPSINNGRVIVIHPNNNQSNDVFNAGQIKFICNEGYSLYKDVVPPSCAGSFWLFLPKCKRDCTPLISTNLVKVHCKRDFLDYNCTKSVEEGTEASLKCKEFYTRGNGSENLKCEDGNWNDNFIECVPECGKPLSDELIEKWVYDKQFPWQVYIEFGNKFENKCKGTIITPTIVLSAASCFTDDEGRRYKSDYFLIRTTKVKPGDLDDDRYQMRKVKTYYIPPTFKGKNSKFEGELAVVILKKPLEITNNVQPVCIDLNNKVKPLEFSPDKLEKIEKYGGANYAKLTEITKVKNKNRRFIDYKNCVDVIPKDFNYSIDDKFCAKSTVDEFICDKSEAGEGLLFADENNRFYLRGVLAGKDAISCSQSAIYTDIYKYKDFINTIIQHNQIKDTECGELTANGETYVVNGQNAIKNSFPWHIGLYQLKNNVTDYRCGGSIISPSLVITAAHCLTNEAGVGYPAEEFYVAAGKYYSDYDAPEDTFVQKSRVKEYRIPSRYLGYHTSYAGDLAVLILKQEFKLTNLVKPICVDWKNTFEDQQLKENKIGSVVGWGSIQPDKIKKSEELKQLNTPYVDIKRCLDEVPGNFRRWITSDKFCAGYTNGSSVCKGDSGGGLVFERKVNNKQLFYIRGVVSVGPTNRRQHLACNNFKYGVYTKISPYLSFIQQIKEQFDN